MKYGERDVAAPVSVHDVFKTQGPPTVTYVDRDEGMFERRLSDALKSRGTLCLLTGPSKTGKTSLYTRVVDALGATPLVLRCSEAVTASDLWRHALEKVNFARKTGAATDAGFSTTASAAAGGQIGLKFVASGTAEGRLEHERSRSRSETHEHVVAAPAADHLIPILQKGDLLLVIEDFHYLRPDIQRTVFQQWKAFVDNEVSVLIVGTTHHASDLAHANKDLLGRIAQIDLTTWGRDDLAQIAIQGLDYLDIDYPISIPSQVAAESEACRSSRSPSASTCV